MGNTAMFEHTQTVYPTDCCANELNTLRISATEAAVPTASDINITMAAKTKQKHFHTNYKT